MSMYFVNAGECSVRSAAGDTLATRVPGEFFGELALTMAQVKKEARRPRKGLGSSSGRGAGRRGRNGERGREVQGRPAGAYIARCLGWMGGWGGMGG